VTQTREISVTVNGRSVKATVESRLTLVDFLRGELELTGTHVGCEHGVCGACTILFNGRAVRSCIMLAVQADGGEVRTVEGLASGGELHPIQEAFLELLERNPNPSDDEILDTLGGQLCRCTGYEAILKSVRTAIDKCAASPGGAKG
jgi:carbon-monoxide dehydrogenase small subunit